MGRLHLQRGSQREKERPPENNVAMPSQSNQSGPFGL